MLERCRSCSPIAASLHLLFISPYRSDRDLVREIHADSGLQFFEIFIGTPLDVCEQCDPKGLYKKARAGLIKGFVALCVLQDE